MFDVGSFVSCLPFPARHTTPASGNAAVRRMGVAQERKWRSFFVCFAFLRLGVVVNWDGGGSIRMGVDWDEGLCAASFGVLNRVSSYQLQFLAYASHYHTDFSPSLGISHQQPAPEPEVFWD